MKQQQKSGCAYLSIWSYDDWLGEWLAVGEFKKYNSFWYEDVSVLGSVCAYIYMCVLYFKKKIVHLMCILMFELSFKILDAKPLVIAFFMF